MKINIILLTLLTLLIIFMQTKQSDSPEANIKHTPETKNTNRIKSNKILSIPGIDAAVQDKMEIKKKQLIHHNNTIQKLGAVLQTSEDAYERISAINQLEKIGGVDALNVISTGLSDNNIDVRSYVIKVLSKLDSKNVLPLLGQVVLGTEKEELKLQALDAISVNINSTTIALLQLVSKNETNDIVKRKVDEILAHNQYKIEYQNEEVTEDYYDIMQRSRYLPPKEAVQALKYVLQNSPDESIRVDAILALSDNTEKDAAPIIKETLLSDKSSNVRFHAIKILPDINDDILPILGQVLFSDGDPDIRIEAINLISMDKSPANLSFLRQALNDSDEKVRNAAAQHLH